MTPTQLIIINGKPTYPSPLKINKDSHFIKKKPASPPSSASSSSSAAKPPHRQPVIIYTHSPKIIHTHPRDFMALVQKLTGQSSADSEYSDHPPPPPKQKEPPPAADSNKNRLRVAATTSDDTDSSSVVTDDQNCSSTAMRNVEIKSCVPPHPTTAFYEPPPINPCFNNMNIPFFPSPINSGDHFYSSSATHDHQPFFNNNYNDSLFLMNNMRSSISSSSSSPSRSFQGMTKEFREF